MWGTWPLMDIKLIVGATQVPMRSILWVNFIDNCWVARYNCSLSCHYDHFMNLAVVYLFILPVYPQVHIRGAWPNHSGYAADEIERCLDARWLGDAVMQTLCTRFSTSIHTMSSHEWRVPIHPLSKQQYMIVLETPQIERAIQRIAAKDTSCWLSGS